uniref:Alpha/beta hydrolase fold-3 domain-containing protein n=1 Tax=Mucochytrium quahogii TaxID=96639 RepID=A0A7S2W9J5_9STRA|mmetsp:Transcript_9486/g.17884  ORF Transcript_9486/g.17884 Transcript_9486/m.17884 type:complete len:692 (-) Transcript_9486:553-2628(-)|eukprot:CAMPEP_0203751386 /NCGR_PEP_ID=MMETSP0098-20131031/5473_1 /ASSEMBLY_ACC=CAM_ASM_000208 /TAXON_ID=96639 /ORGANISM=" , Strain NY0313808BC1" /LENGTH=691 /DNA_ID=CAMNT_0050641091 /DNA_START=248 /DNA_END=2323 /DNA_ORIENTATION=+
MEQETYNAGGEPPESAGDDRPCVSKAGFCPSGGDRAGKEQVECQNVDKLGEVSAGSNGAGVNGAQETREEIGMCDNGAAQEDDGVVVQVPSFEEVAAGGTPCQDGLYIQDDCSCADSVRGDLKYLSGLAGEQSTSLMDTSNFIPASYSEARRGKLLNAIELMMVALRKLQNELDEVSKWLPSNVGFVDHIAICLDYTASVLQRDCTKVASRSRIGLDLYKSRPVSGSVDESLSVFYFKKKTTSWRTRSDLLVAASKVNALQQALEMVRRGQTCPSDDWAVRVAVGECELYDSRFVTTIENVYDIEKAQKNIDSFISTLMVANASVFNMFEKKGCISRATTVVSSGVYYGCCRRKRGKLRGEVAFTGTTEEIQAKLPFASFMWNLPAQQRIIGAFYSTGLPSIRHSVLFKLGASQIQARFISSEKVGLLPSEFNNKKGKSGLPQRAIILHFHGGGFISLDSFCTENYTRLWSKYTKCPIISVDYGLSPEHVFPVPVEQAFEAYKWCVEVAAPEYKSEKIILAGDSAGGNLCAAIAILCIEKGFRKPDGLLLAYPALDIRRQFTPSMMWSINDKMIPYMFLQCCLAAYLGTTDVDEMLAISENHLASPFCATDEVVARFPRTECICATRDPLFDTTMRFCRRMQQLCPDKVHVHVAPEMIHGFLSLNWPLVGVPEVLPCIRYCSDVLCKMISS